MSSPDPEPRTYEVVLPDFAGPLDLLLTLIERHELDISNVSLVAVTDQYVEKLHEGAGIDPDRTADFLVIAGKLLLMKSISLLSTDPAPENEEDPGEDLTQMLLDYQQVKRLADGIRSLEESEQRSYGRLAPQIPPTVDRSLDPIDGGRLLEALNHALSLVPAAPPIEATVQRITIEDQQVLIRSLLVGREEVSFDEVLEKAESRAAVILSFLALLELLKTRVVEVLQEETFGPIRIRMATGDPVSAAADRGEEPD